MDPECRPGDDQPKSTGYYYCQDCFQGSMMLHPFHSTQHQHYCLITSIGEHSYQQRNGIANVSITELNENDFPLSESEEGEKVISECPYCCEERELASRPNCTKKHQLACRTCQLQLVKSNVQFNNGWYTGDLKQCSPGLFCETCQTVQKK